MNVNCLCELVKEVSEIQERIRIELTCDQKYIYVNKIYFENINSGRDRVLAVMSTIKREDGHRSRFEEELERMLESLHFDI